jgi:phosphate/phosphite/phosphonate ABC transporter binding protein
MAKPDVAVFGYVADGAIESQDVLAAEFAVALSRLSKVEVATRGTRTYAEVTSLMLRGEVDFAWLPPVPYIALSRRDAAEPLVSLVRDGHAEFYSVLVVRGDAGLKTPRDLEGTRAAWVDPHSASGYVLPRIGLSAVGLDPRVAFREEHFYGSHEGVVRAVVEGRADFGATFGGLDAAGTLVRGAWSESEAAGTIVVLATFGGIPPDVVAARTDLPTFVCESLTHAFTHADGDPELGGLVARLFGGRAAFKRGTPEGYLDFCRATMRASEEGLLEGTEKKEG